jgi:hypothetical protein
MNFIEALECSIASRCPKTWGAVKLIGFIVVLKKFIRLLVTVYKQVLRKKKNLKNRYGAHSWAFITGSSEGKYFPIQESVNHLHWPLPRKDSTSFFALELYKNSKQPKNKSHKNTLKFEWKFCKSISKGQSMGITCMNSSQR